MKTTFILVLLLLSSNALAFQIEGVPFVKQDREQCGPASLASVFSYYGVSIHPDLIRDSTYTPKLKGALITDLENFSRRYVFQTEAGQGSVEQLKELIHQKKPVIVLVDLGSWAHQNPIIWCSSDTIKRDSLP